MHSMSDSRHTTTLDCAVATLATSSSAEGTSPLYTEQHPIPVKPLEDHPISTSEPIQPGMEHTLTGSGADAASSSTSLDHVVDEIPSTTDNLPALKGDYKLECVSSAMLSLSMTFSVVML